MAKSVFDFAPPQPGAKDYFALTAELLKRVLFSSNEISILSRLRERRQLVKSRLL